MQLAALAFVGARRDCGYISGDRRELVDMIATHDFEDFRFTLAGVTVACEVEYEGYESPMPMGYLWPVEGSKQEFLLQFSMERN